MEKLTEDTLMVTPVDVNKLLATLTILYPPALGSEYVINDDAVYDGNVIIDCECCYGFLENHLGQGVDGKPVVEMCWPVCVRIKTKTEEGYSLPLTTSFTWYIPISVLTEKYCKEKITLKDFMGSRYNYNPRISTNMREFLKAANE